MNRPGDLGLVHAFGVEGVFPSCDDPAAFLLALGDPVPRGGTCKQSQQRLQSAVQAFMDSFMCSHFLTPAHGSWSRQVSKSSYDTQPGDAFCHGCREKPKLSNREQLSLQALITFCSCHYIYPARSPGLENKPPQIVKFIAISLCSPAALRVEDV